MSLSYRDFRVRLKSDYRLRDIGMLSTTLRQYTEFCEEGWFKHAKPN